MSYCGKNSRYMNYCTRVKLLSFGKRVHQWFLQTPVNGPIYKGLLRFQTVI